MMAIPISELAAAHGWHLFISLPASVLSLVAASSSQIPTLRLVLEPVGSGRPLSALMEGRFYIFIRTQIYSSLALTFSCRTSLH